MPTLIKNARRFPDGETFSLLIEGAEIAALDPAACPEGAGVIDAQGKWLLPAFFENHLHIFSGGVSLDELNLIDISGEAALAEAVADFRKGREGAVILSAYSANYEILGPGTRPDRHALDRICPDQPFYMSSVDMHAGWANTAALRLAGLMDAVPTFPGAEVVVDAQGLPTGELIEFDAMRPVLSLSPNGGRNSFGITGAEPDQPVSDAGRTADKATIRRALQVCASLGITHAVNMDGNLYQAELLTEMAEAGELPIRLSLPMCITAEHSAAEVSRLMEEACRAPVGLLSFGRIKLFMDGVFDTWTALRTDDYPDRPGDKGEPLIPPARFAEICIQADALGLQLTTHAVGDGAVRAVVDGYEAAILANGRRDARHRIEHLDMVHPDDLARIKALDIVASMQPVHPPGSCGLPLEPTVSIMGRDRWADTFPWRAVKAQGIPLCFSTDWPTAPLDPRIAIHAALTRQPWGPEVPDQRLPLEEVFAAYTTDGAWPLFLEGRRGALVPGEQADLMLIDGNPADLADSPEACRVLMTLMDGQIIYEAE